MLGTFWHGGSVGAEVAEVVAVVPAALVVVMKAKRAELDATALSLRWGRRASAAVAATSTSISGATTIWEEFLFCSSL